MSAPLRFVPVLILHLLFLASGAAGLMFEQLWFRLAGLSFGNTVWASTTVLAAFMGGLALGNALAAWGRLRFERPLRWYALAELAIAVSGVALLWLLPRSGVIISELPPIPGLRLAVAFALMLIPTTAMGLTLPLVLRALYAGESYGSLLGRLYGINTLGAVVGVLIAEFWLIGILGMQGTALVAGGLNLAAALLALWLNRAWPAAQESRGQHSLPLLTGGRWLLLAGVCGALLLALEVVWFRLLLLHVRGTASAFAVMLATVLAGIALGGWLAGLGLRRQPVSTSHSLSALLLTAIGLGLGYRFLPAEPGLSAWLGSVSLMLATAVGSGALFTLIAAGHAKTLGEPSRATGRVLVANTTGGMLGAAIAGLWLLPHFGMHTSLILCLTGYLLCAGLLIPAMQQKALAAIMVAAALLAFPWSGIQKHLDAAIAPWQALDQSERIFQREGLNETVQLLERRLFNQPLAHRVVTNGDSMSGTERDSRRYMKLFAWLPMALHPQLSEVLLISYGLGSTAEALVADPEIGRITVVDISPEILQASRLTHIDNIEPLDDERLEVVIEDGRHFLLTTEQRFDLITGEPPPPRLAGVVNLYTQEYFQLMHARLRPGGLATYWLPVDQLTLSSSRAIMAAFCAAFNDCSLWSGSNYNWILLGSRDGTKPIQTQQPSRLWQLPATRRDITALGFERPTQLGATFMADARQLAAWYGKQAPLTDDWPKHLEEAGPDEAALRHYAGWLDNQACARRFESSSLIDGLWPQSLRRETLAAYEVQPILNNEIAVRGDQRLRLVDGLLEHSPLKIPVFWLLGSGIREQRIIDHRLAETGYQPEYAWHMAVRALADRRYEIAAEQFHRSHAQGHKDALGMAILAYCRAGQAETAMALAREAGSASPLRCW